MVKNRLSASKRQVATRTKKLTAKQAKIKAKILAKKKSELSTGLQLVSISVSRLRQHWRLLFGIGLIYMILNIVFASGIGNLSSEVNIVKANLQNGSGNHPLVGGVSGFLQLVFTSGASSTGAGSAFQSALIVVTSLAIIWALRQAVAGKQVTVKQAFYNCTSQLVPFLLVLAVMIIQILPITLGAAVVASIFTSVGIISGFWIVLFAAILIGLYGWTMYMLSSSVFALYIVTLPGVQPRQALKSAKELVSYRRSLVLRKVLFLPLIMLVAFGIVVVPLIIYATVAVTAVFYVLSTLSLLFALTYLYSLYKELIG